MNDFIPEVNIKAELLEIAKDFSNPLEIFREAISNSFDAKATEIKIDVYIDRSSGDEELIIEIIDNGEGLIKEELRNFFGLGFSTRTSRDNRGNKISGAIGEKGHGTKIFYNSKKIEIKSVKNNKYLFAKMDKPLQTLRDNTNDLPKILYKEEVLENNTDSYLSIKVYGYNDNQRKKLSFDEIKDYIFWFTKFGSPELELGINKLENTKILLRGVDTTDFKELKFGHIFPPENKDIKELKKIDSIEYLDYFVAKWIFKDIPVIDHPDIKLDIVFYIEGDKVKRTYNNMLHKRFALWKDGEYNAQDRYGLWLCKDFIPIERHNEWVSEKSEYTKYHSFVNCQNLKLTANRGDTGNTSITLIEKIGQTVKNVFKSQIESTKDFELFREEIENQQQIIDAEKEEKDFKRRKELTLKKRAFKYKDLIFFEPRQEGGVFSIIIQLLAIDKNFFNFKVIDYDTSVGYDLLVTNDIALDLNKASMFFVEIKYILEKKFNHSFNKLASIICWDTPLTNDTLLTDLRGEERYLRITSPKKDEAGGYTKYMLINDTAHHNIEVFVLKQYLEEKFGIKLKNRIEVTE